MKRLSAIIILGILGISARELRATELIVPDRFFAQMPNHGVKSFAVTDEQPIFYILVHGTFSEAGESPDPKQLYWGESEFVEKVPKDFFGLNSNPEKEPIRFAFGWSGKMDDDARKKGGKLLADGIKVLKKAFPKSRIICLGHSHGGNVINVASQTLNSQAIDYVIQLATPVLCYNEKAKTFDNKSGYYPDSKGMANLMLFYSDQDFVQSGGAGLVSFKRRYAPIKNIDLYNVRMRKDRGIDDLHIYMHDRVVGTKILQLCQQIKKIYKYNKNLIADITSADRRQKFIDDIKPEKRKALFAGLKIADIIQMPLVSIKPYVNEKSKLSKMVTGKSTDSFWPDLTGKYPEEDKYSEESAKIFKNIFGFPIFQDLSIIERTAGTAKAIGKEGQRQIKSQLDID